MIYCFLRFLEFSSADHLNCLEDDTNYSVKCPSHPTGVQWVTNLVIEQATETFYVILLEKSNSNPCCMRTCSILLEELQSRRFLSCSTFLCDHSHSTVCYCISYFYVSYKGCTYVVHHVPNRVTILRSSWTQRQNHHLS